LCGHVKKKNWVGEYSLKLVYRKFILSKKEILQLDVKERGGGLSQDEGSSKKEPQSESENF
jgi:hypothetical protein